MNDPELCCKKVLEQIKFYGEHMHKEHYLMFLADIQEEIWLLLDAAKSDE